MPLDLSDGADYQSSKTGPLQEVGEILRNDECGTALNGIQFTFYPKTDIKLTSISYGQEFPIHR